MGLTRGLQRAVTLRQGLRRKGWAGFTGGKKSSFKRVRLRCFMAMAKYAGEIVSVAAPVKVPGLACQKRKLDCAASRARTSESFRGKAATCSARYPDTAAVVPAVLLNGPPPPSFSRYPS